MEQFKQLIEETVEQIKKVTELLYQQKNDEAFKIFQETLTLFTQVADHMFQLQWVTEDDKLAYMNKLREAMEAMEAQDSILLSDILQYEIMEFLEELKGKVL